MDYAKPIPIGRNQVPHFDSPPAASAIGSLHRENGSTSSVTAFHANATVIEVAAGTTPATIRWAVNQETSVVSAASGANFDHVIGTNEVRRFVIPRLTTGIQSSNSQGLPSVTGLNVSEGLFPAVATKSNGVGSVLLTQY